MTSRSSPRHGAALILAIILLAGLLLLGLPFLFSQSASLAGTRSLAYQQQATVGRDAAEQLGLAVGAETVRTRFLVDGNECSSTLLTAVGTPPTVPGTLELVTVNTYGVRLDTAPLAYNGNAAGARLLGATIADEQGKLDVNHLDVAAWDRLLKALNIPDWDDNAVLDSEDLSADPASDPLDNDGVNGPLNGDNDDDDTFGPFGELAEALAKVRFSLPGQRITALEQLLLADTIHWTDATSGSDYTNNDPPAGKYGFRRPLTRAELELLRPYLSVHVLGQGRLGLVDLGTTIAKHPDFEISYFDSDLSDVLRPGSVLAWNLDPTHPIRYGLQTSFGQAIDANGFALQQPVVSISEPNYIANRAFAIALPAAVNLHHALDPVRLALNNVDALPTPIARYTDLDAASGSGSYHYLDPLFTRRELPPIDIASFGVIQIDSAAVANDPLGRSSAQRRRRVYAQAVPQESPIERHWSTQGQLYALLLSRAGSRLDSWPRPVARVRGWKPDEAVQDPAVGVATGLRPKTLPSLASGWAQRRETAPQHRRPTHVDVDWKLALGSDGVAPGLTAADDVVKALHMDTGTLDPLAATGGAPYSANDLRPDGLHVEPGRRVGAVIRPEAPVGSPASITPIRAVSTTVTDMRGSHLSFWIKPDADFAEDKLYPLLETRIPAGSAGKQMDGIIGFSELQNYLGLFYDRKQQLIVLVLAPPTIEHTVDSAIRIPPDDVTTTFDLDERCLGSLLTHPTWLPLAPRSPHPQVSGPLPAAPWDETNAKYAANATRLLKPNRVVHLYKVADAAGKPFFREERWCQIQVVLGGSRPGQAQILVDGEAGRNVSRSPPTSVGGLAHGDHLSLPVLPLEIALPMVDPATQGGGVALGPMEIKVKPALGLNAADLFHARGMLRIDDEYITYESIDVNTFKNCIRGQRQNTRVDAGNADERWPNTQQHLVGTTVAQGGYRLDLSGGTLLRGGCVSATGLPNGDATPIDPARKWSIWCEAQVTALPFTLVAGTIYQFPAGAAATTLPVKTVAGSGVFSQFPPRGIIKFGGQIFAYTGISGNSFTGLVDMNTWTAQPTITFPARTPIRADSAVSNPIELLSLEVTGNDPLQEGRYSELPAPFTKYLQLQHPGTGRVEWISYSAFVQEPSGAHNYVYNSNGWKPITRGRQRTDFLGRLNTRLFPADTFPLGTAIIPVQMDLGSHGHWLATGDVVTLRRKPGTAMPPAQLLVRYAAMDGYDAAGGVTENDCKNEYFAFDRPIPDDITNDPPVAPLRARIDASKYEILSGNCWSGADLTPLSPINEPRDHLPRLDLLAGTLPATLCLAATDRSSLEAELAIQTAAPAPAIAMTAAESSAYRDARPDLAATIDAVVAGNVIRDPMILDPSQTNGIGIEKVATSGGDVFTGLGVIGQRVVATMPMFTQPMGLFSFDGEVFAYRREGNANEATIIGTGQLGSFPAGGPGLSHAFPDGPTVNGVIIRPILPALPLPVGPVTVVGDAVTANAPEWFRFVTDRPTLPATPGVVMDAPAVLLCSPDGDPARNEVITLTGPIGKRNTHPQPREGVFYNTATWLRGQYNTPSGAAGQVGDIAIGWWPRYPSALPASASLPPGTPDSDATFRSRAFAWASFPLAMHGARFDSTALGTLGVASIAQVAVQPTATDDLFSLEARASGDSLLPTANAFPGWSALPMQTLANAAGDINASMAFAHPEFTGPVDGAELRITWHYLSTVPVSGALSAIANAGNRAPMLGRVRLRALAPAKVLAVEDAR